VKRSPSKSAKGGREAHSLQDLLPARSSLLDKLVRLRDWARQFYPPNEMGPDGNQRGEKHCEDDDRNAARLVCEAGLADDLSPAELYLLAAALITHDVGREAGSEGHGEAGAQRLLAACDSIAVSRGEALVLAEITAAHDLTGPELAAAMSAIPLESNVAALGQAHVRPRRLALVAKLADILATCETRVDETADPARLVARRQRAVYAARRAITGWRLDDSKRTILLECAPNTLAEQWACDRLVSLAQGHELDPITAWLAGNGLPTRVEPSRPRPPSPPSVPEAAASPGLYWFAGEHEAIFKGRDGLIDEVVQGVTGDNALPLARLFGVSGAGKSSLVAAGVIPRLARLGWLCQHLRPDCDEAGVPGWRSLGGDFRFWPSASELVGDLRRPYQTAVAHLGVFVALDQLEDLAVRRLADDNWLQRELRVLTAEREWLAVALCYRDGYVTRFEAISRQVSDGHGLPLPQAHHVLLLSPEDARDALAAAPELSSLRFEPPELLEEILEDMQRETYEELEYPGVYPPYLQITIEALAEKACDGVATASEYRAFKEGRASPLGALIGGHLLRRLDLLSSGGLDHAQGRRVLEALVDAAGEGRTSRASAAAIAAESEVPETDLGRLLPAMADLRLVRAVGNERYEIAHDYLGALVARDLSGEQRAFKFARDSLRRKAEAYPHLRQLLAPEEQRILYSSRDRVHPTGPEEQLLLRTLAGSVRWEETRTGDPIWTHALGWFWLQGGQLTDWASGVLAAPAPDPLAHVRAGTVKLMSQLAMGNACAADDRGPPDAEAASGGVVGAPVGFFVSEVSDPHRLPPWGAEAQSLDPSSQEPRFPRQGDVPWGVAQRMGFPPSTRAMGPSAIRLAALSDPDPGRRRSAFEWLAQAGTEEDLPLVQHGVEDEDEQVRRAAVGALKHLVHLSAPKSLRLLRRCVSHWHWRVRRAALEGLGETGAHRWDSVAKAALDDGRPEVRNVAARVLLQGPRASRDLVRAKVTGWALHEDRSTRQAAFELLAVAGATIGIADERSLLGRGLRDQADGVALSALRASLAILGEEGMASLAREVIPDSLGLDFERLCLLDFIAYAPPELRGPWLEALMRRHGQQVD